jgi:hypothetical protein
MFYDFKELLSIFNAQKVKYLIVGGYAVHPGTVKPSQSPRAAPPRLPPAANSTA